MAARATTRRAIRVVVVEDQPLYRQMVGVLLESVPGFSVVGSVATLAEAAELPVEEVDVALLDLFLPDGSGVSLGLRLRERNPALSVVLISATDAVDALLDTDDADGWHRWSFLSKTSSLSAQTLVATLQAAADGRRVLDPELVHRRRARDRGPVSRLTARQFEVLSLVAEGLSNREIAHRLRCAPRSVDNHLNAIYDGLDVKRDDRHNPRAQAVRLFLEGTR